MHEGVELLGGEGLLAVALGVGGVVVHLDDQAVGTGGHGGQGQGLHHPVHAGGVGGVDDDGQVAHLLDGGDGGHVQGVAGIGLKGAHPPLAEDHVLVAGGHDVLGGHDPLLIGVGQAPLEEDGLAHLAHLLEQLEVLHVAGAHLHHVHLFLEELGHAGIHEVKDLGKHPTLRIMNNYMNY